MSALLCALQTSCATAPWHFLYTATLTQILMPSKCREWPMSPTWKRTTPLKTGYFLSSEKYFKNCNCFCSEDRDFKWKPQQRRNWRALERCLRRIESRKRCRYHTRASFEEMKSLGSSVSMFKRESELERLFCKADEKPSHREERFQKKLRSFLLASFFFGVSWKKDCWFRWVVSVGLVWVGCN